MPELLSDSDVRARLSAGDAVDWVREAVLLHRAGRLTAPARMSARFGSARLVVTAGRAPGRWYGYRTYDTMPVSGGEQVVVVHDDHTGDVVAVAVGNELGPRRTGALGALAAQCLGSADGPATVAMVGTGTQAWTQLWALNAAIAIGEVRVFSRNAAAREAFVVRAAAELSVAATAVDDARSAILGAGVVVLATNSSEPVIDCAWLAEDVFVTTLGPKQLGRAEFPPELISGATQVVTDSLAQLHAYDPPAVAAITPGGSVIELGDIVAGAVAPSATGRRVFLSVGLAGTEMYLLGKLATQSSAFTPGGSGPFPWRSSACPRV